jgi:hypothetical protein
MDALEFRKQSWERLCSSSRSELLRQAAMRARLYTRDGIEGDRKEAVSIALRAFGEPPRAEAPAGIFRQSNKGGRFRKRRVVVGEQIGASCVLREIEIVPRMGRIYEVSCGSCGRTQIRSSSQINRNLRLKQEIVCPECVGERASGSRAARESHLLERVRSGGPIWSDAEVDQLKGAVLRDLEEEFGPIPEDEIPVADMATAAGWPWSTAPRGVTESDKVTRADDFVRETLSRAREGQPIADLLKATFDTTGLGIAGAEGARLIEAAIDRVELEARRKRYDEEAALTGLPEVRIYIPAWRDEAHRCRLCKQLFVSEEPTEWCSIHCEKQDVGAAVVKWGIALKAFTTSEAEFSAFALHLGNAINAFVRRMKRADQIESEQQRADLSQKQEQHLHIKRAVARVWPPNVVNRVASFGSFTHVGTSMSKDGFRSWKVRLEYGVSYVLRDPVSEQFIIYPPRFGNLLPNHAAVVEDYKRVKEGAANGGEFLKKCP